MPWNVPKALAACRACSMSVTVSKVRAFSIKMYARQKLPSSSWWKQLWSVVGINVSVSRLGSLPGTAASLRRTCSVTRWMFRISSGTWGKIR